MADPTGIELPLQTVDLPAVWRIGHEPDPAAWIPRRFAFHERWDDPARTFRTTYWADSLFAALIELLAELRPVDLAADLDGITVNSDEQQPVRTPGVIGESWLQGRLLGRARLQGRVLDISTSAAIAALHPQMVTLARQHGQVDFDTAALTDSSDRHLTQTVAGWLYALADQDEEPLVEGVQYRSRHGSDLTLWAVFEQPGDPDVSPKLTELQNAPLDPDAPDVRRALALLGLQWS